MASPSKANDYLPNGLQFFKSASSQIALQMQAAQASKAGIPGNEQLSTAASILSAPSSQAIVSKPLSLAMDSADTAAILCASNKLLHHSPTESSRNKYHEMLNDLPVVSENGSQGQPLILSVPNGLLSIPTSVTQGKTGYVIPDVQGTHGLLHSDHLNPLYLPTSLAISSQSPPPATDSSSPVSGDDCAKKREMRLFKNREAARECRRKKKEYVRCLENRVMVLENQNKSLIEELRSLKELYQQKEQLLAAAAVQRVETEVAGSSSSGSQQNKDYHHPRDSLDDR